jgi:hypothetical protein
LDGEVEDMVAGSQVRRQAPGSGLTLTSPAKSDIKVFRGTIYNLKALRGTIYNLKVGFGVWGLKRYLGWRGRGCGGMMPGPRAGSRVCCARRPAG